MYVLQIIHILLLEFAIYAFHLLGMQFEHLFCVVGGPLLITHPQSGSPTHTIGIGKERIALYGKGEHLDGFGIVVLCLKDPGFT